MNLENFSDRRDLLPLPLMPKASLPCRQHYLFEAYAQIIRTLNWLYTDPSVPDLLDTIEHPPNSPPGQKENAIQALVRQYVMQRCRCAMAAGLLRTHVADAQSYRTSVAYSMEPDSGFVALQVDKVSLPPEGVSGSADLLSLLPDDLRPIYGRPDAGLAAAAPDSDNRRPVVGVAPEVTQNWFLDS